MLRDAGERGVCSGLAHEHAVVAFFDLVKCPGVIVTSRVSSRLVELRHHTYDVTGMSPQSMTVAQSLNGLASNGTLYPPLNRTLREPQLTIVVSLCVRTRDSGGDYPV